ncbi:MAG: hypothetical protein GXX96_20625 [Planctomycetaceae bacterium]|nr:hypothetical protein [Planctomycetaceae bacterium]
MKRFLLCLLTLLTTEVGMAGELTVLTPPVGEKAYQIAGEEFAGLWEKVTGQRPVLQQAEIDQKAAPEGDVILIGSDAVNPVVHQLIHDAVIDGLGIEYGGDNYRILTIPHQGRQLVIVAGGSGRSTIYAVYDFFRLRAGAEYFWDGDRIPRRDSIDLAGLDVLQKPHFNYRGLRYFAHRGLHRFQAEHWDLEDWQQEIDWLLKERFNLFMLRTGIDDLFQRAFPGEVTYPPTDGQDPDAEDRSYNDRTSFWALRYRGELRKQVLQYARDRGLLHPEDTGTITHWYSHTPSSFYASHPGFPVITDQKSGYKLSTHAIWDIEAERTWDTYWKLTETHIREFGGGVPRVFHTIGMAERTFGTSDRDNLQRKLYVYRKTQQELRERYPDVPLLIASWDFIGWKWTDQDVQRLTEEFDPQRTIIHDYTADLAEKATFRDWNLPGRFPWIFGIFHGFARNSDIHEDYGILSERLRDAAGDGKCLGLVLWSEISHSDTFLLEYLAENSWEPQMLEASQAAEKYCRARYPAELGKVMRPVWDAFLRLSQTQHWTMKSADRSILFREPQFRMNGSEFTTLTPERMEAIGAAQRRVAPELKTAPKVLRQLAGLSAEWYSDELWRRDALDIARTVANRALFVSLTQGAQRMEAWREGKAEVASIERAAEVNLELYDALGEVLAQSDDFSMDASLHRLERAQELSGVKPQVNPHAEMTLKANAENNYCRSHHYELVRSVNRREAEAYWNWVLKRVESGDRGPWRRPAELTAQDKTIADEFYATPLAKMKPTAARGQAELAAALDRLAGCVQKVVEAE